MEVADHGGKGAGANWSEAKRKSVSGKGKIGIRKEDVTMTILDRYTPPEFTKSVGKGKSREGILGKSRIRNEKGDQGIDNNDVALTIMNRFGPKTLEDKTRGDEGGKENGRG
jgi:hypothetical protein